MLAPTSLLFAGWDVRKKDVLPPRIERGTFRLPQLSDETGDLQSNALPIEL